MPFTFSHPAVILPFRYIGKKYFSITGLIVGTVVPDFEYFIRVNSRSYYSHTWPGIIWFDLPLALLICFLFHNLIRKPLLLNFPYALHMRFMRFYDFNWNRFFKKNWIMVVYSVLIGIVTHILSDWITHKSYHFVTSVPGLIENPELIDNPKSVYKVFQIVYSIIGLILCFFTVWRLPGNKNLIYYKPDTRYWPILCCIFAVAMITLTFKKGFHHSDYIVITISSMMIALIATSLIFLPAKNLAIAHIRGRETLQKN